MLDPDPTHKRPLIEADDKQKATEEVQVPENYEMSMTYVHKGYKCDRNDIAINNILAIQVALNIIRNDEDPKPQNVEECRHINYFPKWKKTM